ncbi:ABC transporter permease [Mycolicibacterium sediminis]|uniref:Transport permease protein n=1 Tax=Mycolicibacterium sediminis TaxID=1286180 RepID=A0A7I7QTM0_9MYCO|nr:ABC transporter permease [Mycolicibacterium sediminis]BBY29759.1 peptide ABC transporter permease [Mycolicibacterium sediminis]
MTTDVSPPRFALVQQSAIFAGRLLTKWRRDPLIPLQSLLFPTILLFIYYMLVSTSMKRLTGSDNLDVVVAMCALAGGMAGSLAAALAIPDERDNGLLSRFWMMPVHRASALLGTLTAEAARTLVATVVITLVGMLFGLRFGGGPAAAVLFVLIPVCWVTVYALLVIVLALSFRSRTVLTWFSTVSLGAVFANSAVAPRDVIPDWLYPAIRFQPMSSTIESMKALARDGFAIRELSWTLAWMVVLAVVVGVSAMRSYRKAAQSG